jgi:HD-like signal output (HDOD) protein
VGFLDWFRRRERPRPAEIKRAPARPVTPRASDVAVAPRGSYRTDNASKLIAEVRKRAAAAKTNEDRLFYAGLLRALLNEGVPLPAMPEVALEIQRAIDAPRTEVDALIALIAADPAVATKVVGVANSVMYRTLEPAHSLKDAVVRIGFRETRNVVLAILSRSRFFRVPGFETETAALYRRTLAVSLAAQSFAARIGVDPDEAFLAGLVHDLGTVVILTIAADVVRTSKGASSVPRATIEEAIYTLHAQLGALTVEAWDLTPRIAEAIIYHHRPNEAPAGVKPLASVLAVADEVGEYVLGDREVTEETMSAGTVDVATQDIVVAARASFADYAQATAE